MPGMNDDRPYLSAVSDSASDVATITDDDEPSALDILEPGFKAEPHGRVEIIAETADDHYAEDAVAEDAAGTDLPTIAAHSVEVVEGAPASDLISGLEADIDLVEAAMSHLDNNDLAAADEAVSQLDRGTEPTLFAAVVPPVDEAE